MTETTMGGPKDGAVASEKETPPQECERQLSFGFCRPIHEPSVKPQPEQKE